MKTPLQHKNHGFYKQLHKITTPALVFVVAIIYCFSSQSCTKATFEKEFTIIVLDSTTLQPLQGICVQFHQNDGYSTYELVKSKSYESEIF